MLVNLFSTQEIIEMNKIYEPRYNIKEIVTGGLEPALTFWVDIDLKTSRDRKLLENPDRLETGGEGFYKNVRTGYQKLYESEPNRIVRLDGTLPIDSLSHEVYERVSRFRDF